MISKHNMPDQKDLSNLLGANTKHKRDLYLGQDEAPPGKEDELSLKGRKLSLNDIYIKEKDFDGSEVKQHVSILDKTEYKKENDGSSD